MTPHFLFLLAIGVLGLLGGVEPRASVFTFLLLVIGFASLSRFEHPRKKAVFLLLVLGALATTVGMVRFVGHEALAGIGEARGRATSKKAVSLLREILFAQDAMRRLAMIDPDGDGIGSAGVLGELSGAVGARGGKTLSTPPLSIRFSPRVLSAHGPVCEQDGYLLMICIPKAGGGWAIQQTAAIDDERAERTWIAYAWPVAEGLGHEAAYFINEHEEILESSNRGAEGLSLVGPARAPSCDHALVQPTRAEWHVWNDKARRASLPGEKKP